MHESLRGLGTRLGANELAGHPLCDACGLLLLPRGGGQKHRRCDCCGLVVPAAARRHASDPWDVSQPYEHAALSKMRMPWPLVEQPTSVMPGRGGRSFRAGKRLLNDES